MISLDALNGLPADAVVAALDGVFEHAPWVAARIVPRRPFATVATLHAALMDAVRDAPEPEILAFLNAHPELAADKLPTGLTDASQSEQLGLAMRDAHGADALPALNRDYRARFGFPFIVCVARHTAENVLRTLHARLANSPADERKTALDEVARISLLRLLQRVEGPGAPSVAGHLSVHALDLAAGRPAIGLAVTLLQEGRPIARAATDPVGRIGGGLIPEGPIRQGRYELAFEAGAYFAASGTDTFYDIVPIRFVAAAAEAKYHIPLLLAPFGYSTYRGN